MEPVRVHIDIESYSQVDLTKVGLWVYAHHPSTSIELVSWAVGDGAVQQWDINDGDPRPWALIALLNDPQYEFHAFNAPFERIMFEAVWNVLTIPNQWHCTMIHAWSLGFSGGLGDVGMQMGLAPDKQKLADGKKLVLKFCKPAPKNRKVDRYTKHNSPVEWEQYREYNRQDVVAERQMKVMLLPYPIPALERAVYLIDQQINLRGLPIDTDLVDTAVRINAEEKAHLKDQLNTVTGLANGNSGAQLLPWLEMWGYPLPNLQKATVAAWLQKEMHPQVRQALEFRAQVNQTSTAKYAVVQRCTHRGRLHGVFQFAGAQRTQRWAGRMFQPHNLKRGFKDADVRANLLEFGNRETIEIIYGDVMDYLSGIMRTVVTAPPGKTLAVSDYGSIESRILGYIANCHRINNLFANDMDTYRDFATEVYGVQYHDVTGDQRFFCKPPVLGCGYQLGAKGLVKYADGMGVTMNVIEAARLVKLWREMYPEVVDMWEWLTEACKYVTKNQGVELTGYCVTIYRDNNYLFIRLPSGRSIAYHHPLVQPEIPPWESEKAARKKAEGVPYTPKRIPTLTYMGRNQYNNKWERITTHGGKITENIVQAIARDVLCDGMIKMEYDPADFYIVGHVHDEVIDEVEEQHAKAHLDRLIQIMSTPPDWAPGLILGAEGFITKRYRKD